MPLPMTTFLTSQKWRDRGLVDRAGRQPHTLGTHHVLGPARVDEIGGRRGSDSRVSGFTPPHGGGTPPGWRRAPWHPSPSFPTY